MFFCLTAGTAANADIQGVPFYEDVEITPPAKGIPQNIANLSGFWFGYWRDEEDGVSNKSAKSVVAVEKIRAENGTISAQIVYSYLNLSGTSSLRREVG